MIDWSFAKSSDGNQGNFNLYTLLMFTHFNLWNKAKSKSWKTLWCQSSKLRVSRPLCMDLATPLLQTGCYTMSVFKQSIISLNSSLPSPRLVAIPRLKSPVCHTINHSWRENSWIHTFPKGISAIWNVNSFF